jgi:hypothetical protein
MLKERTHKEDGLDVDKRVFYTLTDKAKLSAQTMQAHRNSKAIALLFKRLLEADLLTEEQLDEILLEVSW